MAEKNKNDKLVEFRDLISKVSNDFGIIEKINELINAQRYDEARQVLNSNASILAELGAHARSLVETKIPEQKPLEQKTREILAQRLKLVRPWNAGTLSDALKLESSSIKNLDVWGFTEDEIKLLLYLKKRKTKKQEKL